MAMCHMIRHSNMTRPVCLTSLSLTLFLRKLLQRFVIINARLFLTDYLLCISFFSQFALYCKNASIKIVFVYFLFINRICIAFLGPFLHSMFEGDGRTFFHMPFCDGIHKQTFSLPRLYFNVFRNSLAQLAMSKQ